MKKPCITAVLPLVVAAVLPSGCVTEGPPMRPPPKAPPPQPEGIVPDTVLLSVPQYGEDSDRNGFYDSLPATIYLFDSGNPNYAMPIVVAGALRFTLVGPDQSVLGTWEFSTEQTAAMARRLLPGPGFVVGLDLRQAGLEKSKIPEGVLSCEFLLSDGQSIKARSGQTVVIGATR